MNGNTRVLKIVVFFSFGYTHTQEHLTDVNYLNCGTVRDRFRSYLNESKENIEHARNAFREVLR